MTSITNGNGTANLSTKFELPALDLKFGSLTEGTNIPPPLPSPVEEEPPEQLNSIPLPSAVTATNGTQTNPEALRNGVKRSAETAGPRSPISTKGPASIRREALIPRPTSQSNASIATDGQSKRASGWFRRLRGSDGLDSKRTSKIFFSSENTRLSAAPKPSGPPPPMIPEFKALGSKVDLSGDGGSLGADLFKNIH